jgi:hypothetical protein
MAGQFMEFDSIEQMSDWMADQTNKANAVLTDEQKGVTWGSHWVRFYFPGPTDLMVIFGYCLTRDEARESEFRDARNNQDRLEAEQTTAGIIANHERGYLFGWAYSIMEPAGEPGDTHRAHVWPIDAETFEAAKAVGWEVFDPDLDVRFKARIERAYQEYREFAVRTAGQW